MGYKLTSHDNYICDLPRALYVMLYMGSSVTCALTFDVVKNRPIVMNRYGLALLYQNALHSPSNVCVV